MVGHALIKTAARKNLTPVSGSSASGNGTSLATMHHNRTRVRLSKGQKQDWCQQEPPRQATRGLLPAPHRPWNSPMGARQSNIRSWVAA